VTPRFPSPQPSPEGEGAGSSARRGLPAFQVCEFLCGGIRNPEAAARRKRLARSPGSLRLAALATRFGPAAQRRPGDSAHWLASAVGLIKPSHCPASLNPEGSQPLAGGRGAKRRHHRITIPTTSASRRDASPDAMPSTSLRQHYPLVFSAAIRSSSAATPAGVGILRAPDPGVALPRRATPANGSHPSEMKPVCAMTIVLPLAL